MSTLNNFSFNRLEDVTLLFTVTGSGSISGWTLDFTLYSDAAYTLSVLSLVPTITDAVNRKIQVVLSSTNTTRTAGYYYFVLARTDTSNHATLANGVINIGAATAS